MLPFIRPFSVFLFVSCALAATSQSSQQTAATYIHRYRAAAVRQMENFGIPASVILAQAIFESGCGKSDLAKRSNNHFGIKCHNTWVGDTVVKTDDAYNECFRKYETAEDSYRDHSIFLRTRKWYAHLFRLSLTDYQGWCRGLKEAGYATYPAYSEELIRIIETHKLYKLDAPEKLPPAALTTKPAELRRTNAMADEPDYIQLARMDCLISDERDIVLRSIAILGEHVPVRIMAQHESRENGVKPGTEGRRE